MTIFWALISVKIIGDIEVPYDPYAENFDNVLTATHILYALASPDIYPDCMLPAIESSEYYLFFFLGYNILF